MEPVRSLFAVLCVDMEMDRDVNMSLNLDVDVDVGSDRDIGTGDVNKVRDRQRYSCGCFPGGSVVKNLPASVEDKRETGSIPGLRRSPGGGHGNSLQSSCLETPVDRGAVGASLVAQMVKNPPAK